MDALRAHAAAVFAASAAAACLCVLRAPRTRGPTLWDALFLACAWEPFNFKLWEAFFAGAGLAAGTSFDVAGALLIALSVAFARRRGLRLGAELGRRTAAEYARHLLALTLLIPVGLWCGFLRPYAALSPGAVAEKTFSYLLIVAPTEELIFRGIGLNVLSPALGEPAALLVVSAAFGLTYSHLTGGGAFPNWTYAAFAAVCGLAYGRCYQRSRSLLAPILLHASVDLIWRLFLSGPR